MIEYFNQLNAEGERWIDFEAEIEKVIISIDRSISSDSSSRNIERIGNPFFQAFVDKKKAEMNSQHIDTGEPVYSYDALLALLKNDFIRITDALEIYLFIYIERFGWNGYKAYSALPSFDRVLSFNYTDTYMRLYDPVGVVLFGMATDPKIGVSTSESMTSMHAKYCYVHGKVRDGKGNYFPDSNRHIILGISDEDDTKDRLFVNNEKKYHDFQKYILRERFGEKNYVEWIKEIKESNPCELHIIGHSLAFSDRDILVPFLTHPNVSTTIYYLDDDKLNDLKENLHELIGKNKFKELCNTKIVFKAVSELSQR